MPLKGILFLLLVTLAIQNEEQNTTLENTTEEFEASTKENVIDEKDRINPIPGITIFTDANYTNITEKHPFLYLLAYSHKNYCPNCTEFFEEFLAVKSYTESKNIPIEYGQINGPENVEFAYQYMTEHFPTIILFKDNLTLLYQGKLNKDGLILFLEKYLYGSVKEVKTLSEIEELKRKFDFVALSTVKNKTSNVYQSFDYFSKQTEKFVFLSCLSESCLEKYGEDVTILTPFKEMEVNKFSVYNGGDINKYVSNYTIETFASNFLVETGSIFDLDKLRLVQEFQKKILFYFRNSSKEEQTKFDPVMKEAGKELIKENIYTFVYDIQGTVLMEETSEVFVVLKEDLPCLVYIKFDKDPDHSFTYRINSIDLEKEPLTAKKVVGFINDIKEKKIKRDLRSGFPFNQASIDYIGARLVIGRTYDKDVLQEKNNVCIAFVNRAYYCELCDKYLEVFRTLGHKYKNVTDYGVVYALIDGVDNEARDIEFSPQELPFIYLYTNAMPNKKRIKFVPKNETEISTDEVEEFVAKNLGWEYKKEEKKEEIKTEEDIHKGDL